MTIYDKAILIYCISQIIHNLKQGGKIIPRVQINSYVLLIFINYSTSSRDYQSLQTL
ncbi:replication initiator protein A [Bartonella bacilliformis]|uniref:replication initiator protein A n=1 Tax=Bartonella bacilliformis TaxID=774 RepID=UPI003D9C305C